MQNILLAITGGIAAYKSIFLCRELQRQGYLVRCVLTQSAQTFVTKQTLQALTNEIVRTELFDDTAEAAMSHIELARWADILLVAPATANSIAKFAHGIADDLLGTLYLATTAKVVIAPAMNHMMWLHPATQANIETLRHRPNHITLPVGIGKQACGETGPGRVLEPEDITKAIAGLATSKDLLGKKVTITAGPTQEAIDPVRFLSNHSSGKMGYALAQEALNRGAEVTLISGPSKLIPPESCEFISVTTALEMYEASLKAAITSDIFIGAAAVSDYRIKNPAAEKQKKSIHGLLTIELIENPDIIASVAALKEHRPFTVGFAAETENVLDYAKAKLARKHLDMVVANDVNHDVFGSDTDTITLLDKMHTTPLPKQTKIQLVAEIFSHIILLLKENHDSD